ncbi:hypothetical protein Pint_11215 [Pistacia integerrima]|uniref:Uncharacterized protein n=1 Tax=Pistacia integerrima TaxID=434235 RepID=A0ACC0XHK1_9ROSI|nr:hypothetical protein Pint_11215 [Pistacia integerrima]
MSSNSDIEPPTGESHSDSLFSNFTAKMTEALTKVQTSTMTTKPSTAPIGIKLNETNYALWSQVVEVYISGKDKLGYINGDIPQPSSTDPTFRKWRTDNAIVKVTRLKQAGGSLEKYYNDLQGLWREIDFRRPNPMECALRPFPTLEQAYAHVRREALRQSVMITGSADGVSDAVLATKGLRLWLRRVVTLALRMQALVKQPCGAWLLDSVATDHMTFSAMDFITTSLSKRTNISNANGVTSPITGAGTVALSPLLQLHNMLLVPSLSHKLLSVSQLTSYLNCMVLMYPTFCLVQDILTKEIIGRGT